MADLKLPQLPDRTPIKLSVTLRPELAKVLEDYRTIYNARHGADEPLSELVPHMLSAFVGADREFAKARKDLNKPGRSDGR